MLYSYSGVPVQGFRGLHAFLKVKQAMDSPKILILKEKNMKLQTHWLELSSLFILFIEIHNPHNSK
jgi:hypothetical protein